MIKKQEKLVITFYTTTDAMAAEQLCREWGLPGRMIPVPGSITADCGLAWCAGVEQERVLRGVLEASKVTVQGFYRCLV